MKAAAFAYARPTDSREAGVLLRQSAGLGKIISGGQSLGAMLNLRLAQPELLVDVGAIASLRECVATTDAVILGANTTHAAIEDGLVPDPSNGLMPYVAAGIAYRAIRNRGTLGGSLAHADPAADWVNLMALLEASYHVEGPDGVRVVAAGEWMSGAFTTALRDDEVLTAVRIPRLSSAARWSYYKVNRKTGEFAQALAAIIDDTARGWCRGLVGATDGTPYVFDATALVRTPGPGAAAPHLAAAGLEPGTYEYQIHLVALLRAVARA